MNSITASLTDVIDAFKEEGFEFIGKTKCGRFRLHGELRLPDPKTNCLCEIQIDPEFIDLPHFRLLDIPPGLPVTAAHIGANGDLCYLAKNAVVLDIFDPVGQSLACLKRASEVLDRVIKGELVDDLIEEFFAYWGEHFCLSDIQGDRLGQQSCVVAQSNDKPIWSVTDNSERTVEKLLSLGFQISHSTILTYRVQTKAQPRPHTSIWPPKTVGDVLSWQSSLDPNCRRNIYKRIKQGEKSKANGVLIIVESPFVTYGFAVHYNRRDKTKTSNSSRKIRDSIHNLQVLPLSMIRIDDQYIAQRNIPKLVTLAGKRIAVIGCGTIGGYLSEILVKAGAGTSGGELTIVDYESIFPQNIGRHRLGFPHLFSNKSVAMANELKRLAPSINVRALPVDIKQAYLGDLDLLIDSSGEEALGHWLCKEYLSHCSMLSVWIEGPGTAVRALLKTDVPSACYRCLWHSNKRGELRSVVGSVPVVLEGNGCEEEYVPFPATVSLKAASLGAEMALDWVNDMPSPLLRTQLIDRRQQAATSDCNPLRDKECPICNL